MDVEFSSVSSELNSMDYLKRDRPSDSNYEMDYYAPLDRDLKSIFGRYRAEVLIKSEKMPLSTIELSQKLHGYEDKDLPYMAKLSTSILPIYESYEEIAGMIDNCFTANLNTYALLQGGAGMGKTSALYYAYGKLIEDRKYSTNNLKIIEVDALIYDKENKIILEILKALDHNKEAEEALNFEKNPYARLVNAFKDNNYILYIKNVDVFAREARQVFLYSLLDNLNHFSIKVMLIFSTSNIFFVDMLEKRVKSRFSYKLFDFYHCPFKHSEQNPLGGLMEILKSKVSSDIDTHSPFSRAMVLALGEPYVEALFKKYHIIGMNIDWFVRVIRVAMAYMNVDDITEAITAPEIVPNHKDNSSINFLDNPTKVIYMSLFNAIKSMNCEFEQSILKDMTHPGKTILRQLKSLSAWNGIKFRVLLATLTNHASSGNLGSVFKFSTNVVKDCLLDLDNSKIIYIDRKPLRLESVIYLQVGTNHIDQNC